MALAFVPLLAGWVLPSKRWGRGIAAALDALALVSTAILWNVSDADLSALFFSGSILAALLFATLSPEKDQDALVRLHVGASLGMVAATLNDLGWSIPAILLFGLLLRPTRERFPLFVVPSVVALLGLVPGAGPAPIQLGLPAMWLVATREVLRNEAASLLTRVAISFTLLVAVYSVTLGLPAGAPLQAIALAFLGLGALGVLTATRVTTLLTAMALARAGLVLFAQLGGMLGRVPALFVLAASGVSLLLLAAALESTETIDEIATLASTPRRLVLAFAALSLGSFPGFPGFLALFPLSSAVTEKGYGSSLLVAAPLAFLLALGTLRLVARAFQSGGTRSEETEIGPAALALALAAMAAFSIAPASLVEIVRAAALGLG